MSEEATNQVVFTALSAATRLAMKLRMSLKELKRQIEVSYYHQAQGQQLKMTEIAALMQVSAPKVSLLSKEFKAYFAAATAGQGLQRRILGLLWAVPMTRRKLSQALEDFTDAEIDAALEGLLSQKRVEAVQGRTTRYKVGASAHRMVEDSWLSRLDGLTHLMQAVAGTVEARFFRQDTRALARTIRLDVRPEDIPKIEAFYREQLFKLLSEMNDAAGSASETVTMNLVLLWAPADGDPPEPSKGDTDDASNDENDRRDGHVGPGNEPGRVQRRRRDRS